jgi:acyl carrier protein
MDMRSVIIPAIESVASEQGKTLRPLSDDLVLLESGLDSLCFAILVTRLEDEVGFDPFTLSDDVYFPVTLADLIRFYDDAARDQAPPTLAA